LLRKIKKLEEGKVTQINSRAANNLHRWGEKRGTERLKSLRNAKARNLSRFGGKQEGIVIPLPPQKWHVQGRGSLISSVKGGAQERPQGTDVKKETGRTVGNSGAPLPGKILNFPEGREHERGRRWPGGRSVDDRDGSRSAKREGYLFGEEALSAAWPGEVGEK